MEGPLRLQKVLAESGVASRRAAERIIAEGRVKVNGVIVTALGTKVLPGRDRVEVDGAEVVTDPAKRYCLLYKPAGYLSTVKDPQGRKTVIDLLPRKYGERLYPVGRLDLDAEGLLLMTNDGELAFRLTHPRYRVPKSYRVTVKGVVEQETLDELRGGMALEDGVTAPAEAKVVARDPKRKKSVLELTLTEGKKRQVKRMCEAVGHPVQSLKRVSIAFLDAGGLEPGRCRELSRQEVRRLYRLVGLS